MDTVSESDTESFRRPQKRARARGGFDRLATTTDSSADSRGPTSEALLFDALPDDLAILVMSRVAAAASSSSDLAHLALTCKRWRRIAAQDPVLARVSLASLAASARLWQHPQAGRFITRCAGAGNVDALFTLGMMKFYCEEVYWLGAMLLACAAERGHCEAIFTLALIKFHGSGGHKTDQDARGGVMLCWLAARKGHLMALEELGYCCVDGYGTCQRPFVGRKLLQLCHVKKLALLATAMLQWPQHPCQEQQPDVAVPRAHRPDASPKLAEPSTSESSGSTVCSDVLLPSAKASSAAGECGSFESTASWPNHRDSHLSSEDDASSGSRSVPGPHVGKDAEAVPWEGLDLFGASATQPTTRAAGLGDDEPSDEVCFRKSPQACPPGDWKDPRASLFNGDPEMVAWGAHHRRHPVYAVLADWFAKRPLAGGRKQCSNSYCQRPETRRAEFRSCLLCRRARYCTRACQSEDWFHDHHFVCKANPEHR